MAEIEIVPDQMGGFEINGRRYEVSAATDAVIRFIDPKYDYLRYLDPEQHAITLNWLGSRALATLVGFGIPETRQRLKIQQCEYDEWQVWHERHSGLYVPTEEPLALPPSDPIDAEVQQHMQKFDQEAEFYLYHEWPQEGDR